MSSGEEFPEEIATELRQLVRGELERLPDLYRQPVMLCYLEGLTHQEAAHNLGWPLGTVKIRLVRGRRLLRERLDRRGVSLGSSLVLWLVEPAKAKAVQQPLLDSTVRAMNLAASGRRATLASDYARAVAMAEAWQGIRVGPNIHWLWSTLALAALVLGLTGSIVVDVQRPLVPEVDPTTLPANLTNVLTIDCG
jgi:hypothetical protein